MNKSLISVVIPCYNGEKYLKKCFDSLLNQTYQNLEIIIVDDGSVDNSSEIILEYKEKFESKGCIFKNLYQNNSGQAAAVNNALKYVTGEYMVWQDCDDYYEYDALESLYNFLNETNMNFVRGRGVYRDDNNLDIILSEAKSKYPNKKNIFDFYVFEKDSYLFVGIFMVRMSYFDKYIKNRNIYTSRAGQNWQLILPIAYYEQCGYLDKVVYNYRVSQSSHYHSVKKLNELFKRCKAHKDILFNVINNLQMNNIERNIYKIRINFKYAKKRVRIILSKIKHIIFK